MHNSLKILTLVFLVFKSGFTLACDCAPHNNHDTLIERSFEVYPFIFIGTVIQSNQNKVIEVLEVFKGDLQEGQKLGAGFDGNSCSLSFVAEGKILFYGHIRNSVCFASICSPTRMFERPYLYPPPPPPVPGTDIEYDAEKALKEHGEAEKKRLKHEIAELKRRKTSANIKSYEK
jgi:hypothetical protein